MFKSIESESAGKRASALAPAWSIFGCGIVTFAFLFACRFILVWRLTHEFPQYAPSVVSTLMAAMRRVGGDALALAALLTAAILLGRNAPRACRCLCVIGAGFLMILAAINVRVAQLFGQPATLNLMRFAGLRDIHGLPAVVGYAAVSDFLLFGTALLCTTVVALVPWERAVPGHARDSVLKAVGPLFGLVLAATVGIYLFAAADVREQHANAGWWLASSVLTDRAPLPKVKNPDIAAAYELLPGRAPPIVREGAGPARNVVMIVLESVGAEYLDLDRHPERTPRLAALHAATARFDHTYVSMPSSGVSLYGLLTSAYPVVSGNFMGAVDPRRALPSLLNVAKGNGRRTATFFSSTWGFDGAPPFPKVNGADLFQDDRSRSDCPRARLVEMVRAATPDRCTFASLKQWIGQSREPFFALLWTDDTHYPYRGGSDGEAVKRSSDPAQQEDNYLKALAGSDQQIGALVDWLSKRGQLDDTLLVIVGDHGEAFGQHGNFVHGWDLYEETTRVPLLFINPRLFSGTKSAELVRNIDIAPTILGRMGLTPPESFQGVDLASGARPRRVYYSTPWAGLAMGYREGNRKYVYHLGRNQVLAYDLALDPGEQHPRVLGASPERSTVVHTLLNWAGAAEQRTRAMAAGQKR